MFIPTIEQQQISSSVLPLLLKMEQQPLWGFVALLCYVT